MLDIQCDRVGVPPNMPVKSGPSFATIALQVDLLDANASLVITPRVYPEARIDSLEK